METIKQITEKFENCPIDTIISMIDDYVTDDRKQVVKLRERFLKKYENHLKEIKRLSSMYSYECNYYNKNIFNVMGIDEAGRGPLCGPVVVSGVILQPNSFIKGLNDSKKMNEKKRNELYDEIMKKAVYVHVEQSDHVDIDKFNINGAIFNCIKGIVKNSAITPDILLIDGNYNFTFTIKHDNIIEGDSKSASIAAASIIAKVTRDRIMNRYDKEYPMYNFAANKGYGTKEHIEAIKNHGVSEIHRKTFVKKFL